ncbi:AraC family transcriptional regulator [Tenacibaculum sp. Bg11-29]|uniref:helix-turn-helix domain-containing protein n=1 Tax=Tenacibaculum sp. Bg11-29 TaxID=2058306 RepID=UPI0018E3802C|nr:helix-turn-helix domain-containing protein [Tenacibaculum sp. Bg11-29]
MIRVINVHNKLLPYSYKNIKYKKLTWLTIFCVICIVVNIFYHISHLVFKNNYTIIVIDLSVFLIPLYYVTIVSLVQINIYNLTDRDKLNALNNKKLYSKDELEAYFDIVEKYLLEEKIFLNPSLNLKTFAERISLPSRAVSNCIYQINGTSFNYLIHTYRVDEFKKIIKEENYKNYSIEALSCEVGYNSRASFYKNFKMITGTSPSKFISKSY